MKQRGMTLLELLIAMAILLIIIGMSGIKLSRLLQRARVAAAKSTVSGFGLALSSIRLDTGSYPQLLSYTKEAEAPVGFSSNSWYGPYAETLSLVDPWGNNYYYKLIDDVVFGPTVFERTTGGPYDETFTFSATPGTGRLIIDNSSLPINSGTVWLNGTKVVKPNEFGGDVTNIEKSVTLLTNNTVRIRLTSNPGHYFILTITSPNASGSFTLLSYGRGGEPGGLDFEADIIYGEF